MKLASQLSKPSLLHRLDAIDSRTLLPIYRQHCIQHDESGAGLHIAYMREIERIFEERGLPRPTEDILCEKAIAAQERLEAELSTRHNGNGRIIEPV